MTRLALMGDVMLGRHAGDSLAAGGPAHPWGDVLPRLLEADLRLLNLECVVASCGEPVQPKTFHFRAPVEAIRALEAARVDFVSLANNHVLDYGEEALLETLDLLDEAGIARAGAGRTAEEAWRPALLEQGGLRIAVLSFTDNEPSWAAGPDRPGTAYVNLDQADGATLGLVECASEVARGCDALIVSAHWGPNMRREPPPAFQRFARSLVDAGTRVLWGHSAHLFQAVEHRGTGAILYDTGDFVDDYIVDDAERNDLSFLFEVELRADEVGDINLQPVRISPHDAQVRLAGGEDAEWAIDRMWRLCGGLGTTTERADGGLRVPAVGPPTRGRGTPATARR